MREFLINLFLGTPVGMVVWTLVTLYPPNGDKPGLNYVMGIFASAVTSVIMYVFQPWKTPILSQSLPVRIIRFTNEDGNIRHEAQQKFLGVWFPTYSPGHATTAEETMEGFKATAFQARRQVVAEVVKEYIEVKSKTVIDK